MRSGMKYFRILALFGIILCLSGAMRMPTAASDQGTHLQNFHLPLVEEDAVSPSGQKTTWDCVCFGSYPCAEVADSSWDSVDDYALRDGDLIRDDVLYERLQGADWEADMAQLDGISYIRVQSTAANAEGEQAAAGQPEEAGQYVIREQHYRHESTRLWHYFQVMPIRWRVLDVQDDKALLLADRMPDCLPFHAADADVSWQECTLRSWLNGYDASANQQKIDYTGTI